MDHFQRAIQAKPNDAEAYNNLGIALAGQGKWAEAIQRYEQAIKIRPDYAKARISLGLALAAQGKLADGLEQMQQALALATAQGNAPLAASIRARIQSLQPNLPLPPPQ
jgi:tetratricopeptide (TPR) repeat protein